MNFEVGDEVIYNPSLTPLPPINKRPWDLGRIKDIKNGYIHFESYYWGPNDIHRISPESFSYSTRSPKYVRTLYALVIKQINEAFLRRKTKLVKNIYPFLKRELIMKVFINESLCL
jgi:hypothetical protein